MKKWYLYVRSPKTERVTLRAEVKEVTEPEGALLGDKYARAVELLAPGDDEHTGTGNYLRQLAQQRQKEEKFVLEAKKTIPQNFPIACISVHTHQNGRVGDGNLVSYGISIWNPLDEYSKAVARNKADGRNEQQFQSEGAVARSFTVDGTMRPYEVNRSVLQHVWVSRHDPEFHLSSRVLRAIRVMLDTPFTPKPKKPAKAKPNAESAAA